MLDKVHTAANKHHTFQQERKRPADGILTARKDIAVYIIQIPDDEADTEQHESQPKHSRYDRSD